MTWQIVGEGAIEPLKDQPPFLPPDREPVPMEEQAARASRFVSQQAGHTENERQLPNSNRQLPLLMGVRPACPMELAPHLRVGLLHLGWALECSVRRTALTNPSLRGSQEPPAHRN